MHGDSTHAVHTGDVGKWRGIAALGTKLFAAPSSAPVLLVVETFGGALLPHGNSTVAVHRFGKVAGQGSKTTTTTTMTTMTTTTQVGQFYVEGLDHVYQK